MFWGLTLESGKHYSQSVEDSFHVSMAALELEGNDEVVKASPLIKVMVQHQKKEFLLCSMIQGSILIQQQLDLDFTEGEEVTFYIEGNGVVHLTGYLVQEKSFEQEELEPVLQSPCDSSEDGMEVSGDDSDDQDDTFPTLQDLAKSDDIDSEDEGEDWIPEERVTKSIPTRKLKGDANTSKKKREDSNTGHRSQESDNSKGSADNSDDPAKELDDLFNDIAANTETGQNIAQVCSVETGDASKKRKRKKKKQLVKVKMEPSESSPQETAEDGTEDVEESSQKLSDLVELAAAIALFPGKLVTLRVLKCSGKRSVRMVTPEEFDTAMSCLEEFGQKLSVYVPRCSKPVVVFLKQFPHLIKEDVWNSIVTKENYTLQFYKKSHAKISPNVRKNCISMTGLSENHFDLVQGSDGTVTV